MQKWLKLSRTRTLAVGDSLTSKKGFSKGKSMFSTMLISIRVACSSENTSCTTEIRFFSHYLHVWINACRTMQKNSMSLSWGCRKVFLHLQSPWRLWCYMCILYEMSFINVWNNFSGFVHKNIFSICNFSVLSSTWFNLQTSNLTS